MFGKKRNTSKTESTKNTPAKKPMLKTTAFTDREDLVNFINHNGINPDDFTIVGTQNFYTLFYY
ncbi:hypothetical protein [uncultured Draconibacterium sp.]|uniref:hypothetical protein n=1 Tax=uncultured Draconibacterium sp. TaxID=1573823 RepID=UPI00321768EA